MLTIKSEELDKYVHCWNTKLWLRWYWENINTESQECKESDSLLQIDRELKRFREEIDAKLAIEGRDLILFLVYVHLYSSAFQKDFKVTYKNTHIPTAQDN